ncbi:uncharacterized protein LOC135099399 [Scylla paramamosain]|uniref:uncharacterized protein LOC135099399 n=1 Tax=Scylla paramamosain TaxID=85552 RepID=UPI0030839FA2
MMIITMIIMRLYHSCPYYQASIQAAALPGTDGCLASPRVPAGLEAACAGGSGAAVEVVRPGSSMSGRQRRQQQQQQQQQQPASGVGRHRRGGKNHLEAGSSVHRGERASLSASSVTTLLYPDKALSTTS